MAGAISADLLHSVGDPAIAEDPESREGEGGAGPLAGQTFSSHVVARRNRDASVQVESELGDGIARLLRKRGGIFLRGCGVGGRLCARTARRRAELERARERGASIRGQRPASSAGGLHVEVNTLHLPAWVLHLAVVVGEP